ncbi:HAD family hydrolase [Winogradskyella tangerina]|uniref:HAD family hydrolase n=1 Tax=Winogradskyella tangerina TaxID=2023240 RepID=UPI00130038D4|nr:HAD family hydrolase [Winogradskyella tangerina]
MSLNQLHKQLKEKQIKFLFTDYYDTIVHRRVHPNYVQRIWAKMIIRELGLTLSIDNLYFTRQESVKYLEKKLKKDIDEIPYQRLKEEVCKRLINDEIISTDSKEEFIALFEIADARAEASVQYLDQKVLDTIKYFKSNGGKVYLISDFYGSISLFEKLLEHHGIIDLFDGIYTSSSSELSKYSGTIYEPVLSELDVDPKEAMMIGDNERSDYSNAIKSGLSAYLLPHKKYTRKNKRNNFGNDKKQLRSVLNALYNKCKRGSAIPFTEYAIFYHIFAERLYETAKRKNIKDLFFLSREGQYLKKLFDSYQEFTALRSDHKIRTHYLKISRHAALQMSLQDIEKEPFTFLSKKYSNISTEDFLIAVNCPDELRESIINDLNVDGKASVEGFFSSSIFESLKQNKSFLNYYDKHRSESRKAFETYIQSFGADIENEGIHLADIGWGGTMQEAIYTFFDEKIPVTGYYLGLNEIYDIQPLTKRYGLNFSLMPYPDYNDHIIMANMQLYEQFSAADHGSALDYSLDADGYTLEYHKPEEKWLYDNHIKAHQEQMSEHHKELLSRLQPICYSEEMMQVAMSKIALKVGLFQSFKKLKFLDTLSHGFYQNVGTNQVGISYEPPKIKSPVGSAIRFLMTPEKYFRYLVKLKPALYKKNKAIAMLAPMWLFYLYFGFNKYFRFKILKRYFLLKYNAFK